MYTKDRDSAETDEKVANWRIRRVLLYKNGDSRMGVCWM